jgi:hypothetical protein
LEPLLVPNLQGKKQTIDKTQNSYNNKITYKIRNQMRGAGNIIFQEKLSFQKAHNKRRR